jgi:hypothetical protein
MDPGRTLERVGEAHGADQLPDFACHLRSAAASSRFPSPEQTKTGTMPSDAFFRLQFSADYTITMFGFDFRQGQSPCLLAPRPG